MASSQYFFILAIVAILVPSILATEFVVGDDKGGTVDYNYIAWAQGKEFHVNQVLGAVFKYTPGSHIVLEVNEIGFQQCVAPLGTEALVSGNDVITLAILGRNWYICGVANHCQINNQKLAITESPAPSPVSDHESLVCESKVQNYQNQPIQGVVDADGVQEACHDSALQLESCQRCISPLDAAK
ncbi:blue copper protein 1a-like [Corylus avellana]|uniref:blue copper protein 1a-like n=1 Tax=Corylus avellana TaxID=13451 RepID=UPI00286BE08B|nr:blue copper protein 1a-like [Corylus avellana]